MIINNLCIAQKAKLKKISEIAKSAGIRSNELKFYGDYIAKISPMLLKRFQTKKNGKLILVTSITPTKFGEGKTSTAIGLTQALGKLKKKVFLCLRQPSLGPIFGIKGGACGGGYSQVLPMEDINLHFTGDSYAVSAANNLACAVLDNYIYHNNRKFDIDVYRILIRRSSEIGDRSLRKLTFKTDSSSYNSGFDITAASEIMAILSLCKDMQDLKKRIEKMAVAFSRSGNTINCKDIGVSGAMLMLLKDAIMPNLVQTMEGQPAFIHCGPFANIAHGANSVISLSMALKLGDYVVTESGFGSDLGAEKFFNIVCRAGNFRPDLAVIVASARALKIHGKENLLKHVNIVKSFGINLIVAVNIFGDESEDDIQSIVAFCEENSINIRLSNVVKQGGLGGLALAEECVKLIDKNKVNFKYLYKERLPLEQKIDKIAKEIYGAKAVVLSKNVQHQLKIFKSLGYDRLPVNIAKTQFSLSDNLKLAGVPKDWILHINELRLSAGAGFVVAIAGKINLMPGLPKEPSALHMGVDDRGIVTGI